MDTKLRKYGQDSASCRNMEPKSAKSPPKSAKRLPKGGFRPLDPRMSNRLWLRRPPGAPSRARGIAELIKWIDQRIVKPLLTLSDPRWFTATFGLSFGHSFGITLQDRFHCHFRAPKGPQIMVFFGPRRRRMSEREA